MEANACEIWSREAGWSVEGASAGVVLDRAAAFSAATIDSGRDLGRSGPCDGGLLCHDRAGDFVVTALDGEDAKLVRFDSWSNTVSLVGEVERMEDRSIASAGGDVTVLVWVCRAAERAGIGEGSCMPWDVESLRRADGGGVLIGDDFWGDMDLARSGQRGSSCQHLFPN